MRTVQMEDSVKHQKKGCRQFGLRKEKELKSEFFCIWPDFQENFCLIQVFTYRNQK